MSLDAEKLKRICAATEPAATLEPLLKNINAAAGGREFSLTYTDKGWYRVGGIVTATGERVADDLEQWVRAQGEDDIISLAAQYADSGYLATAISGKTFFLSASSGPRALDFIQIEVEELREVTDRELFDHDNVPDTIEDIIDPMECRPVKQTPVAPPVYQFKQLLDFSAIGEELTSEYAGDPAFRRFLRDWEQSSASGELPFHKCWAVEVLPVLADVGEHKSKVRLWSPHGAAVHTYDMSGRGMGGGIVKMLASLDREAGYPMAWYFLMLTKKFLSPAMLISIREEMGWSQRDSTFLAANDRRILESWIEAPYTI
ncbi:MAG TPA: hypothetical protein PK405_04295 [Hyphomicrobiales bacterium]|nr:hypothetical protein [Rhodobiaceae bacterium]HXK53883.1 hypothetical protein [Hyphomicrobiales bacterium]